MTEHEHHYNPLAASVAKYEDARLEAIFEAAVAHLQQRPELCGMAVDPSDKLAGHDHD